jgi:hypothetical protein
MFGDDLVEQGVISERKLKNQDEIDKFFGEIAVSHGFLATG